MKELQAMMTFDDRLDDVSRARIWAKLDDRLADRTRARGWRWWWAAGAAAAVATVAVVVLTRTDASGRELVAPADATLTASLGPYAQATIVGPARLVIESDAAVKLDTGTLYAQFEGGPGRALRVVAPGAVVDVVGTLFAVEARGAGSCVSVAHGRVRVTAGARVVEVGGGGRWCTGDAATKPIEPRVRDALARHERIVAMREPDDRGAPSISTSADTPASTGRVDSSATHGADPAPAATRSHASTTPTDSTTRAADPAPTAAPYASTTRADSTTRAGGAASTTPDPVPTATGSHASTTRADGAVSTTRAGATRAADPAPTASTHTSSTTRAADPAPPASSTTGVAGSSTTHAVGVAPADARAPSSPDAPIATPSRPDEALFREAEAALARHDAAAADRALARLLADEPYSPLVDQALYERARIAYQRHAWLEARRHLDALAAVAQTPLAEPGRYLACRIAAEAHDADAPRCLADFRAAYPRSPHDLDILGMLVQIAYGNGGCAAAKASIDELARASPKASLTGAWRTRCPEAR